MWQLCVVCSADLSSASLFTLCNIFIKIKGCWRYGRFHEAERNKPSLEANITFDVMSSEITYENIRESDGYNRGAEAESLLTMPLLLHLCPPTAFVSVSWIHYLVTSCCFLPHTSLHEEAVFPNAVCQLLLSEVVSFCGTICLSFFLLEHTLQIYKHSVLENIFLATSCCCKSLTRDLLKLLEALGKILGFNFKSQAR